MATLRPHPRGCGLLSSWLTDENTKTSRRRDLVEQRRHRPLSPLRGARAACAARIVAVSGGSSATKLLLLLPTAYGSARLRQNIFHIDILLLARVQRRWCIRKEWLWQKLLTVHRPLI